MLLKVVFITVFLVVSGFLLGRFLARTYGIVAKLVLLVLGLVPLMILTAVVERQAASLPASAVDISLVGYALGIASVAADAVVHRSRLEDTQNTRSMAKLTSYLKGSNWEVRREAVRALGNTGGPEAVTLLADELLAGKMQREAALALAQIGTPEAVDILMAALTGQSGFPRRYSAEALGTLYKSGRMNDTQQSRLLTLRDVWVDRDHVGYGGDGTPVVEGNIDLYVRDFLA